MSSLQCFPPVYCSYYKNLVVEEIALNNYLHLLHYGKCAVIGSTSLEDNGLSYLQNIKINSLPKEYSLPSGATKIILLDNIISSCVPTYKICEVFGEVVLYDNFDSKENILPKTSKDLFEKLAEAEPTRDCRYLKEDSPLLEVMRQRYSPALKIHTINLIDEPHELIECNLAIRYLSARGPYTTEDF